MTTYRWRLSPLALALLFTCGSVIAQEKFVSKRNTAPVTASSTYWTPERMAAARPEPLGVRYGSPLAETDSEQLKPDGAPGSAPPQGPGDAAPLRADPLAKVVGDTQLPLVSTYFSYPYPFTRSQVLPLTLYTTYPWNLNGRLFFTKPGIGDYVCTATSVTSGSAPRRALILTAGHCVSNGSGAFWTNFRFVPALRDTVRPYGTWDWDSLVTTSEWHNTGNFKRDVAFIVTRKRADGQSLGTILGGVGLAWNQSDKQDLWAHGYPIEPPFNGLRMILCTAAVAGRDSFSGTGPAPMALGCDQTGGSSGGSWKRTTTMNTAGYAMGVFSYKYDAQPLASYSPYFDTAISTLWTQAQGMVKP